MTNQHIGHLLDSMNVNLDISDNQHLTEVFIVGKVIDLESGLAYLVLGSNGLDWITEGGLLSAAEKARTATIVGMIQHNGKREDDEG